MIVVSPGMMSVAMMIARTSLLASPLEAGECIGHHAVDDQRQNDRSERNEDRVEQKAEKLALLEDGTVVLPR